MSEQKMKATRTGKAARLRPLAIGVLGAAAVTAGIFFLRGQRQALPRAASAQSPEDAGQAPVSLERLRELGI